MAGDWVPWVIGLPRKREVLAIAQKTGRDRFQVAGLLAEFWGWLSIESRDCHVASVTKKSICDAIGGGDEEFFSAVEEVGWLKLRDGISIPNAGRWNGRTAKKRLLAALRQRRKREEGEKTVTPKSRSKRDKSVTTKQYSNISSSTSSAEIAFDVPSDLNGLELYVKDRKLCARWVTLLPKWQGAFPGVDVLAEVRKAHAWECSCPENQKTDRPKFLFNWLSRAQQSPRKPGNGGYQPQRQAEDPVKSMMREYEETKEAERRAGL